MKILLFWIIFLSSITLADVTPNPGGGGGGSATAAGDTGEIQFNASDAFQADDALFWDNTNKRLSIGSQSPTSDLYINSTAGEPTIRFRMGGGGADAKSWQYTVSAGTWYVQTLNDAENAGATAFSVARTGNQPTLFTVAGDQGIRVTDIAGAGALEADAEGDIVAASDERLKKDIVPFERGSEAIAKINPKSFRKKDEQVPWVYSGFIAQDVEKAIPEAVSESIRGHKNLNTVPIMAALVNSDKEILARLDAIEKALGIVHDQSKKVIPMPKIQKAVRLFKEPKMPKAQK